MIRPAEKAILATLEDLKRESSSFRRIVSEEPEIRVKYVSPTRLRLPSWSQIRESIANVYHAFLFGQP
ncbi:MAG TPA: hypothetical protein VJO34_00895 [Methylomirabilota bacterium]|nr:hypothetical protein [Methylomirabilota bacterium]